MSRIHYSPKLGRLSKCVSEKCPFGHYNVENLRRIEPISLTGTPEILKNSYSGVIVPSEKVEPVLRQLREAMTPDLYDFVVGNKDVRDGIGNYHVTTVTPSELRGLSRDGKSAEVERKFSYEILGLGTASNEKSSAWFAVVRSIPLQHYRASLGLPEKDLHITVGFTNGDVHDKPKGLSSLI